MSLDHDVSVDFSDMQALLRFGHGRLPESCFVLLQVINAAAARAWLQQASVTSAQWQPTAPERALQVAFTCQGLAAMGLPPEVSAGFSDEFIAGMAGDANRSRRLGDVDCSSPEQWSWGGPGTEQPDVLLLLYTRAGEMAAWRKRLEDAVFRRAFSITMELPALALSRREPFGFEDGISQPQVDWWGQISNRASARDRYRHFMAPGELALGYVNEYGLVTDRPLLATDSDSSDLPEAVGEPGKRDLGRNGTYLVLRQLLQDVHGFWGFVNDKAAGDVALREQLAAVMVGRRRNGDPLVPAKSRNDFDFDNDSEGQLCPLGAHVRRANPRTGDFPAGVTGVITRNLRRLGFCRRHPQDDLIAATRFHRVVRRGRAYGPELTPEQAVADEADAAERGLHFISLGASISRQFEFVQNAWLSSATFAGLAAETDPLLGGRELGDGFSQPREGHPPRHLSGLPRFVTVLGGAYFFLPGLRALRYIARSR